MNVDNRQLVLHKYFSIRYIATVNSDENINDDNIQELRAINLPKAHKIVSFLILSNIAEPCP
jgi:hypothetical protein